MKTKRGIGQVVFNFLPDQTADLGGAIWRVARWSEPRVVAVDGDVVRSEVLRSIYPWTASGRDSGLADDLRRGAEVMVIAPNEDGGVAVESFPRTTGVSCAAGLSRATSARAGVGRMPGGNSPSLRTTSVGGRTPRGSLGARSTGRSA